MSILPFSLQELETVVSYSNSNRDLLFAIYWPELGHAPPRQLLQQIGRGQKSWQCGPSGREAARIGKNRMAHTWKNSHCYVRVAAGPHRRSDSLGRTDRSRRIGAALNDE